MAEWCALYWLPHLVGMGITPAWASEYECRPTVQVDDLEDEAVDKDGDEDFKDELDN